ncbi:glycoside hydrolase family 140 protein [Sinorhizobium sp. BJ1]|uniref:glycoside hydrolase family 140 protein n=1 Tax=Sinorhizobium sp. BJ1 TaxID=2035455 RepID=UPI0015CF28E0|nr:glycoside hydrolase family 140 protein [Sinorhizobium sp. BJ1]
MQSIAPIAAVLSASLLIPTAAAQEMQHGDPFQDFYRAELKVSDNKRYLVFTDGTPFFYLSDTNWEFFRRATREDAERLLEKRRKQRFTVISGPVTGILDAIYYKDPLGAPNPYGDLPFIDKDVTRPATTPGSDPNDATQYDYWDHVDHLVSLAESKGLFVALLPAWWDHYRAGLVNRSNARAYGRFIGLRFGARRNIIWVLGGDTSISKQERTVYEQGLDIARGIWRVLQGKSAVHPVEADTFRELAAGIKETESRPHLMTFHPRTGVSSAQWFHDEPWLDFNMLQSGHETYDLARYELIADDYNRVPAKPTMDAESAYEDQLPYGHWDEPEKGWYDDYDVRQAAYWGLFAGGHGYAYGNRGVWQMYEPGREPSDPVRYYWYQAMDLPGARHMTHLRNLMLSRPMLGRVPDQSLVENAFSGGDHIRATRGDGYAFIYAATGKTFRVNPGGIAGGTLVAWWFDPRSGGATRIGEFPNSDVLEFDPPGDPKRGNDWVLALDSKNLGFQAPGVAPAP